MAAEIALLHGFTHTGASWEPVTARLEERYKALAPDLRGHGASADVEPVSLEAVIDDISALMSERFTLVGYSMGGRIALHVALDMPRRVKRLVLVGASPGIADEAEREARRAADDALAAEIESMEIEPFARRWAQGTSVLSGQSSEVRRRAHTDRLRNTPLGLARALRGLGTGSLPSLWDRLAEISQPVTLVVGERDEKFRDLAGRMAALLPVAELIVVPGVGHAVHLEAPSTMAKIITREADTN